MSAAVKTSSLTGAVSPMVPVLVCALAIFLLSGMDAAMKTLVIAVGVYNTVLWRSFLATAVAGAAWSAGSRSLPTIAVLRLHALRAVVVGIVLISFFWGLGRLPLAEAVGLSFVAPLIALFLAALLLAERVRREAIWASMAGIAGVAIIVSGQFGQASYSHDALLGTAAVLVSTVFYGYNLILARQQAQVAKPIEIMFFQSLAVAIILGLAAPWLAIALPASLWLLLAGVTALSLAGQFLMSWSYARAEAQYLIPTEYSAFIWAIAFGWFFFDEAVTWTTLAGACLIVAGCLIAARANPKLAEPIEAAV
ncbi:DMT family transporter [Mesorhizobium sp. M4B.F.Ca.ET.215.01.1.1]|uniref:DMT family transporter n=1 Tax=unclassified Mesorhizobium TaxID=325217 RepID=UPI000FCB9D50|nr:MULTISPECIES: DMT family transporter [unclassified Mesorhizobium]RUW22072.1 DMT family transporter [Mesorhizobium sp. M4B.F.Ca.ET.013.02.1.1]RVD38802.1 DMT family transporter [Mesorhizobium sp. M4B.F.Ca.ET.019.03.1.1]RWC96244.1 MAG: DMT family transporter [Mesorhizobium sp.]RWF62682.1 MAG: DMT family transporter [Mesorhizobium sp.]TGQ04087.1 DMT family transporter [Mesorhizobium sp. M4B.F.Ca.ET.215.01.1.1]